MDKDGQLDMHEFVVAMYLADVVKAGHSVPAQLDPDMIPPDKRK
jgi:Cytoskeletal-regulatory complex EF hand